MSTVATATLWQSIVRESKAKPEINMLMGDTTIDWNMIVSTVYDEDTGVESIRIKHIYIGPLKAAQ